MPNNDPVLTPGGPRTGTEGGLLFLPNLATYSDDDPFDAHTLTIDWGDGSPLDSGAVDPSFFHFVGGGHAYADNDVYAVTLTIMDNRGGSDSTTITVTVDNVDPTLTGTAGLAVDEAQSFTLTELGVGLSDPGFDTETFANLTIDWGDGTAAVPYTIFNLVNGASLRPTTAQFNHAPHAYADDSTYTVTVMVQDDDGPAVARQFEIVVRNVLPKLTVPGTQAVNEGSLLTVQNIGVITDPGFANPANPLAQPGGSVETFRFFINWGDNTPADSGNATIDDVGGIQDLTDASFDGSHTYADSGTYTVTVRVADDDMSGNFAGGVNGVDFVSRTFTVLVVEVGPTLTLSGPPDINEGSVYTLTLTSADPGSDTIASWTIDWGDSVQVVAGDPASVTHVYADGDAPFIISATASDEDGTYPAGNTVSVTVHNVVPTLTLSGPADVNEGTVYTLTLTSADPGSDTIASWTINWGDSVQVVAGDPATVTHVYADGDATFMISATATDEDGTYPAGNTVSVTVHNVADTERRQQPDCRRCVRRCRS